MKDDDLKLISPEDLEKLEAGVKRVKTELVSMATVAKSMADEAKKLSDILQNTPPAKEEEFTKLLKEFEDYHKKRADKAEEYNKKIEQMKAASQPGVDGKNYSSQIAEAEKQRDKALAALDDGAKSTTSLIYKLFADSSQMSIQSMRNLANEAKAALDFIDGGEYKEGNAFGMTEAQFNNIKKNVDEYDKFNKKVNDIRTATDKAETGFNKMGIGMKKVFDAGGDTKKLTQGLAEMSEGLTSVTAVGKMFGDSFNALGDTFNSDTLKRIGSGVNSAMEIAGSTMKGAQAGAALGPAGAIVGAGVGLATSVAKLFSGNKKHRDELRKQVEDNAKKYEDTEREINRLYRERYDWSKKIGESNLSYIARQGQELKKQSATNQKEQDDLWSKLMASDYNAKEEFKRTGFLGWGKGKIKISWEKLDGKSWKEIETLAAAGKLSEQAKEYYEILKKSREEGENLAEREVKYLEDVREQLTGTTYDSLVTSIVDGFKAGKQSAADFADAFEKLMKTAVAASLERFVDDSMRGWYEEWSTLSENGLTEDEIAYLQRKYNDIIDSTAKKKEELEQITGVNVAEGSTDSPRSSSSGFGAMSQDTANELNGRFSALQMSGVNLEQSSLIRNEQLSVIGFDTSQMRANLSLLNFSIDEIREINRVSMNHLYKIEKNTALLRDTNSLLAKVATNTARL